MFYLGDTLELLQADLITAGMSIIYNDVAYRPILEPFIGIMKENDPYIIKQIGSRIKSYLKEKWQSVAKQIAVKANTAKFLQNKALLV